MLRTYRFRIKDASKKAHLNTLASKVNFVWNYCNETSAFAWSRDRKWLREFDLNNLTSGASKELGLGSDAIQSVCREFAFRRNKQKMPRLKWRTYKRDLGWIPVKARALKINEDSVVFQKQTYRFWKSRPYDGKFRSASFSQNSKKQWFVNLTFEVADPNPSQATEAVGVDLGLKTLATLSTGQKIGNPKILIKHQDNLAMAQRAKKRKRVASIQNRIKNSRKDFLHKESTKLVKQFKNIFVGDVSSLKLAKTKMAKATLDASWGMFKSMLDYKANSLGVEFRVVEEIYSSVTCSVCLQRTGPSGLSALGIREWICACGMRHDRDVNAAQNILRCGRATL